MVLIISVLKTYLFIFIFFAGKINVFTVTFDQLNAFLSSKSAIFEWFLKENVTEDWNNDSE